MSKKNRVLIVDDDVEILHVLAVLFESEDFVVVGEARDGLDAITLARREQPDFIVLDYKMPRMDGAAVAPVLKAVAPDARVVAFSGILGSKPEWADAFLTKDDIVRLAPLLHSLVDQTTRSGARPA